MAAFIAGYWPTISQDSKSTMNYLPVEVCCFHSTIWMPDHSGSQ